MLSFCQMQNPKLQLFPSLWTLRIRKNSTKVEETQCPKLTTESQVCSNCQTAKPLSRTMQAYSRKKVSQTVSKFKQPQKGKDKGASVNFIWNVKKKVNTEMSQSCFEWFGCHHGRCFNVSLLLFSFMLFLSTFTDGLSNNGSQWKCVSQNCCAKLWQFCQFLCFSFSALTHKNEWAVDPFWWQTLCQLQAAMEKSNLWLHNETALFTVCTSFCFFNVHPTKAGWPLQNGQRCHAKDLSPVMKNQQKKSVFNVLANGVNDEIQNCQKMPKFCCHWSHFLVNAMFGSERWFSVRAQWFRSPLIKHENWEQSRVEHSTQGDHTGLDWKVFSSVQFHLDWADVQWKCPVENLSIASHSALKCNSWLHSWIQLKSSLAWLKLSFRSLFCPQMSHNQTLDNQNWHWGPALDIWIMHWTSRKMTVWLWQSPCSATTLMWSTHRSATKKG